MRDKSVRSRPAPARPANRVRVVGGAWRGRLIRFHDGIGLRPTPDRVRETLFNWLGQDLTGRVCLDLFAGSGALGFESLSRGARETVLVDRSRTVCASLRETAAMLEAEGARVVCSDALEFLARADARFDVVFVDPPYGTGLTAKALGRLPPLLAAGARVYVENDTPLVPDSGWSLLRQGRAGAVHYHLLEWGTDDQSHLPGHL